MQIFDRMAASLLVVVLLVLCPVMLMLQRQDAVTELAVMNVVADCTERWKQQGYLTRSSYEQVLEELALLGSFQVEIDYRRRMVEPVWQDGQVAEVSAAWIHVPWEEIRAELYGTEACFRMYQEDRLTVLVESAGPSPGETAAGRLFGRTPAIRVQYGGIITGELDEGGIPGRKSGADAFSGDSRTGLEPESAAAAGDPAGGATQYGGG